MLHVDPLGKKAVKENEVELMTTKEPEPINLDYNDHETYDNYQYDQNQYYDQQQYSDYNKKGNDADDAINDIDQFLNEDEF